MDLREPAWSRCQHGRFVAHRPLSAAGPSLVEGMREPPPRLFPKGTNPIPEGSTLVTSSPPETITSSWARLGFQLWKFGHGHCEHSKGSD